MVSWLVSLILGLKFFVGHISGKSAFPKPLSKEEEKATLEKYFQGDKEAKDKLIEHNMRLVAHIAKKYVSNGYENDDLISIGSIGLIKAINTFSKDKNAHLATYASRCIENEILMHLRATKKLKNEVSLSEPIGTDKEGNEISLIDILKSDDEDVSDNVENRIKIEEMIRKINGKLTEREKRIVVLRFGLGGRTPLAQREVAEKLGISRSYVSRIEKNIFEKLRQ